MHLKRKTPISDFYTTAEVKEKFGVAESWIFKVAKDNNIPEPLTESKHTGVRNTLMLTSKRKPQAQTLLNGIVLLKFKRNSA